MFQRLPIALAQVKAGKKFRKPIKSSQKNYLFFVSIKRNH